MVIIGEWRDARAAKRGVNRIAGLDSSVAFDDPSEFIGEALALKVAALAEGYSEKEPLDACGGDIARYILDRRSDLIRSGTQAGHDL